MVTPNRVLVDELHLFDLPNIKENIATVMHQLDSLSHITPKILVTSKMPEEFYLRTISNKPKVKSGDFMKRFSNRQSPLLEPIVGKSYEEEGLRKVSFGKNK